MGKSRWHCGYLVAGMVLLNGCAHWPVPSMPAVPGLRGAMPNTVDEAPLPDSQQLPASEAARLLVVHGDKLVEHGREAQAVVQFEKARSLQPDYPGLAHKLAILYDRLAQDQKALAEYQRALKQQPDNPYVLNDFGYFHYQRGRYAEAERYFREALAACERATDRSSLAWTTNTNTSKSTHHAIRERAAVNLGLALAQQGKLQEAYTAFTQALTPAQAHYNIAVVLLQRAGHLPETQATDQQRLREGARQHLQRALQLDGSLRQAQALLSELDQPRTPSDKPSAPPRSPSPTREPASPSTPPSPRQLPTSLDAPPILVPTPPEPPAPASGSAPYLSNATHPTRQPPTLPTNATSPDSAKPHSTPFRRPLRDDGD